MLESVEIRKCRVCLGRSFGVDIDMDHEENGEFSFLKKKQNIL